MQKTCCICRWRQGLLGHIYNIRQIIYYNTCFLTGWVDQVQPGFLIFLSVQLCSGWNGQKTLLYVVDMWYLEIYRALLHSVHNATQYCDTWSLAFSLCSLARMKKQYRKVCIKKCTLFLLLQILTLHWIYFSCKHYAAIGGCNLHHSAAAKMGMMLDDGCVRW